MHLPYFGPIEACAICSSVQFVCCMAFDGGTLYVGLDDGTIKIYAYNDDPSKKNRFVVRHRTCSFLMCVNHSVNATSCCAAIPAGGSSFSELQTEEHIDT